MFAQLSRPDVWRALLAGLGYAVLYALTSQVVWRVGRWLQAQPHPRVVRLQRWHGWLWLESTGAILGTLVYGFALAMRGILAAEDLGLGPVNWSVVPWALGIVCGAAVWLSALWLVARLPRSSSPLAGGWVGLLLWSWLQEGHAAIWRAALMPGLGTYWGVWLAVLGKRLTMLSNPTQRNAARKNGVRLGATTLLGWALDWVSAALFFYSRSLWATMVGRTLCSTLVWLALRTLDRRKPQISAQYQSQND